MSEAAPLTRCPVLHKDRFLIIVNKPAGVLSHPNADSAGEGAGAAFLGRYNLKWRCFESSAGRVWLLHRLDQDTSGVLMGALDVVTAEKMRAAFDRDAVHKDYLALVHGRLEPRGTWLDHLITRKERGKVRTITQRGRPPNAELRFQNLGFHEATRLTLLDIALITGRTHQIRVQAAERQHPVIGDDVYGSFDLNRRLRKEVGIRRLCLHAQRLRFGHPASGQLLDIVAPVPEDFGEVLEKLGLRG